MTAEAIARESPSEGRTAILTAMKELRMYGYAKVFRTQDEKGHWRTVTQISGWSEWESEPKSGKPTSVEPASRDRPPKSSSSSTKKNKEETTTTNEGLDWTFLSQLTKHERIVVVGKFHFLDLQQQQDLLDELAGALREKVIKGQWPAWLHALIDRAKKGIFQPNHALAIRAERDRRIKEAAKAEQKKSEAAERAARLADPSARARSKEIAAAALAEMRRS
ncbi:MAG: hypothetical protein JSS25_05360 [Proteobacteria bacterium]|nr:hypothetical protein [Pseudomonadota bacterium]